MLTVSVQAGGASRRMGRSKALIPFQGRPLVEWVIRQVSPAADELLVTARQPEELAFLTARVVGDLWPAGGSLGGLYTSLSAASHPLVGVVACDMPFASAELLQAKVNLLQREGVDVVIPHTGAGLEPLHAVYRRTACLPAVLAALQAGEQRMISWFPAVSVKVLEPVDLARYDPDSRVFFNINTPEELRQAESMAQPRAGSLDERKQ
jgi:molybdopterin-guanine dinucleotide biosynthesis protein A